VSNTEEGEYVVSFPDLPGCLAVGDTISARSLEEMGRAISNFMKGEVAPAIDLSDF